MMINNKRDLEKQLTVLSQKVSNNIDKFGEAFPGPCATNGKYTTIENNEWTTSFWTGILFICYEFTGDNKFLKIAEKNCESFITRLKYMHSLDHHDIGFLYSLSLVAGYKVTKNEEYKIHAIEAADRLVERIKIGDFIPAWSDDNGSEEVRTIVDSLMNIPLLYWASDVTGNTMYREKADKHAKVIVKYLVRDDFTTFHTYFFDRATGTPLRGQTSQGYKDDSCWARGQAWAVCGLALMEQYDSSVEVNELFDKVLEVFVGLLPENNVPYWDFSFNDENPSDRDSSSGAIAACGLLHKINNGHTQHFDQLEKLFNGLQEYVDTDVTSEGILDGSVYIWHINYGIDDFSIWGDYFYMELLYRLYKRSWKGYF